MLQYARSIVADVRAIGPDVFSRFKAGREGTLWYYGRLAEVFAERLDDAGQAARGQSQFMRSVQLLEHLEFRSAHVAVGHEDQRHDACGGFGAVAGIGAHGVAFVS